MKYKVLNKTYQPFQLMIDNQIHILKSRGDKNYVIVDRVTTQMEKMEKMNYLKITKKR
jgi:hypothetical protein